MRGPLKPQRFKASCHGRLRPSSGDHCRTLHWPADSWLANDGGARAARVLHKAVEACSASFGDHEFVLPSSESPG